MSLVVIFVLGVANFVLHRAVLESGHPALESLRWGRARLGGRVSLAAEFVALLAALLLAVYAASWWAWVYLAYTAFNALGAWLILGRRM